MSNQHQLQARTGNIRFPKLSLQSVAALAVFSGIADFPGFGNGSFVFAMDLQTGPADESTADGHAAGTATLTNNPVNTTTTTSRLSRFLQSVECGNGCSAIALLVRGRANEGATGPNGSGPGSNGPTPNTQSQAGLNLTLNTEEPQAVGLAQTQDLSELQCPVCESGRSWSAIETRKASKDKHINVTLHRSSESLQSQIQSELDYRKSLIELVEKNKSDWKQNSFVVNAERNKSSGDKPADTVTVFEYFPRHVRSHCTFHKVYSDATTGTEMVYEADSRNFAKKLDQNGMPQCEENLKYLFHDLRLVKQGPIGAISLKSEYARGDNGLEGCEGCVKRIKFLDNLVFGHGVDYGLPYYLSHRVDHWGERVIDMFKNSPEEQQVRPAGDPEEYWSGENKKVSVRVIFPPSLSLKVKIFVAKSEVKPTLNSTEKSSSSTPSSQCVIENAESTANWESGKRPGSESDPEISQTQAQLSDTESDRPKTWEAHTVLEFHVDISSDHLRWGTSACFGSDNHDLRDDGHGGEPDTDSTVTATPFYLRVNEIEIDTTELYRQIKNRIAYLRGSRGEAGGLSAADLIFKNGVREQTVSFNDENCRWQSLTKLLERDGEDGRVVKDGRGYIRVSDRYLGPAEGDVVARCAVPHIM